MRMELGRRLTPCLQRRMSALDVVVLSVVAMVTVMARFASAVSRNSAFLGYTERPLMIPQYHGYPQRPKERLVFATEYGDITVQLKREVALKTVQYVKSLVSRGLFDGCGFYRAEPQGPTIDAGRNGTRMGYALLQGGLHSCGRQEDKDLPLETKLEISKGTVALISRTSEFFFSLEDHHEWNGSFSVFGTVVGEASWRALELLVALPTRQEVHPSGTVLRILLKPVIFKVRGINIFQAFTNYLKNTKGDNPSKEELLKVLDALDEHLKTKGPYIAGKNPTDSDFALIPKLHHMRVALAHYIIFTFPAKFAALHKYIELMEGRPSFQETNSPDEMRVHGSQKNLAVLIVCYSEWLRHKMYNHMFAVAFTTLRMASRMCSVRLM